MRRNTNATVAKITIGKSSTSLDSRSKAKIHGSWEIVNKSIEHVGDYKAGIDREVFSPSLYNNTRHKCDKSKITTNINQAISDRIGVSQHTPLFTWVARVVADNV